MYKLKIKKTALKSLEKLNLDVLEAIIKLILNLALNPRPKGCKKLISNKNLYRIRYSTYRIIYCIEDEITTIEIIKISKREDAYKGLP